MVGLWEQLQGPDAARTLGEAPSRCALACPLNTAPSLPHQDWPVRVLPWSPIPGLEPYLPLSQPPSTTQ